MVRVILELLFLVVFAWTVRRLLGVRHVSTLMALVAALVGLGLGEALRALLVRGGTAPDLATTAGLALALVLAMLGVLLMEMLRSRDRRGRAGLRGTVGRLRRRVGQGRRSAEIAGIAARRRLGRGLGLASGDVSPEDAARYGEDLRAGLEEAGGVFVKLGQLLSTRGDLVSPEIAEALGALRQDVAPLSRESIEPALEAGLGMPVAEAFAELDWDPVGTASIGQVHAARLPSGARVVVKVRRPEVSETVERDLQIATDIARALHRRSPRAARMDIASVTEQFAEDLRAELDYALEARYLREAAEGIEPGSPLIVPRVVDELSGPSTLVMTFIEGEPLGRLTHPPRDGAALADMLFRYQVAAMLAGRRFHADPHPGNVIVTPDGRLGLVDFGAAGRLDVFERASMADILTALALRDPTMLRAAVLTISTDPGSVDPTMLDRAFARLMVDHLDSGAAPSAELLADLLTILSELGLAVPPSMSRMMRALVTLQGTLVALDPGYDILAAARAVAADEVRRDLQLENLTEQLKREVITFAPLLRRVPHHVDRVASQLEAGRLSVRVRLLADDQDVRILSRYVNRVVLVAAGTALGVVSALLLGLPTGPALTANLTLYDLLGFIGLTAGAVLLMRVVLEVVRDG